MTWKINNPTHICQVIATSLMRVTNHQK